MPGVKEQLLEFVTPFSFRSGRAITQYDYKTLDELVHNLVRQTPEPDLTESFALLEGTWKCVFTSSRHVLGLGKMPFVKLSDVYQKVYIDRDNVGRYLNIEELSRGSSVKMACGEYAHIQPSPREPIRIDVQYRYFYFAMRLLSTYEGHEPLASALEVNRLPRSFRLPFKKPGWQTVAYLDSDMRIVYGDEGDICVMVKQPTNSRTQESTVLLADHDTVFEEASADQLRQSQLVVGSGDQRLVGPTRTGATIYEFKGNGKQHEHGGRQCKEAPARPSAR